MEDIKKNDEFIVDIIDYGADGEGIAKINGYTIFVIGGIKGEVCKIHILKELKTHAFAKILEIMGKTEQAKTMLIHFLDKNPNSYLAHKLLAYFMKNHKTMKQLLVNI